MVVKISDSLRGKYLLSLGNKFIQIQFLKFTEILFSEEKLFHVLSNKQLNQYFSFINYLFTDKKVIKERVFMLHGFKNKMSMVLCNFFLIILIIIIIN